MVRGAGKVSRDYYGILLVILQYAGIIILWITGTADPKGIAGNLLVWGGLLLGFWALWAMRKSRFKILPTVAEGASLVTGGPYAFVRNPMYLAVLMITLGWVVSDSSLTRWLVWCGMLSTLLAKLLIEERLLCERFLQYDEYRGVTKRLVPWVW